MQGNGDEYEQQEWEAESVCGRWGEQGGVGCSVVLYLKNVTRNEGLCIGEEKERSEGMLEGGLWLPAGSLDASEALVGLSDLIYLC